MGLVLLLIALAGSMSGALRRLDNLVFDLGQILSRGAVPDDLVLVAIDEESLGQFGRWPWSREIHARLIDALCAARPAAIGLDIAFSEPQSPAADAALARAIRRCGKVVLPLVIEMESAGGSIVETPPIPALWNAAAGLGRIGVYIDEDGMARSVDLNEGVGVAAWPLFARELLRVGGLTPAGSVPEPSARIAWGAREAAHGLAQEERRRLQFVGPPGALPYISYADVIEGRVPAASIAGRTVMVGATAVGLGDQFSTPVSAHAQPMPGVEVQANIWIGLRAGTLVRELPAWPAALLSAVLALMPLLWLPRLMPSVAFFASLFWIAVPVAFSVGVLRGLQWWFPPAGAVLSGLFAYPLWSWRHLESARRHLDIELRELGGVLPGEEQEGAGGKVGKMGFEQRIAWVQAARQRVHYLEEQRRETLAFISHDLRAPLASAVQRLEDGADCRPEQLLPPLRRAQSMAQDFLRLARAEALDRREMKTLDLLFILHQAADELYPAARNRGMSIERRLPEEPVWIVGDFEAIERCAGNLLQNAVAHGSPDTRIVLGADVERREPSGICARFWVENECAEWRPERFERLFEKFRRGESSHENRRPEGAGLGLYYVRTVAGKHGGHAGAERAADGKIRFWVELPVAETTD
ncbi:MAG: CHASE2 domain-containing protein [Candidatus Accumulibacter sp.]|nr:CHASE2 domain-containing protein [Accumulibacter sp.]